MLNQFVGSLLGFVKSKAVIKAMKKDELQNFTLGLFETIYRSEKTRGDLIFSEGNKIKMLLTQIDNKLDFIEELTDPKDMQKYRKEWLIEDAERVLNRVKRIRRGHRVDYIEGELQED